MIPAVFEALHQLDISLSPATVSKVGKLQLCAVTALTVVLTVTLSVQKPAQSTEAAQTVATTVAKKATSALSAMEDLETILAAPHSESDATYFANVQHSTAAYLDSLEVLAGKIAYRVDPQGAEVLAEELLSQWLVMPSYSRWPMLYALSQVGAPYVRDPLKSRGELGFDCSGLTLAAWHKIDVVLPHKAAIQYDVTEPIAFEARQPGDLVYFTGGSTAYGPLEIGHVGILIGSDLMVNARPGTEAVTVESIYNLSAPPAFWSRVT